MDADEIESISSGSEGAGFDDDMMADDDFDDEGSSVDDDSGFAPIDPQQKDKRKAYEVDYKVLSLQDIEKRQKDDAESTASILAIRPSDAVILLRHWGWNKDRLFERYMENQERCAVEAGIEGSGRQPRLKRVRGFVCQICFEASSTAETIALTCDHRYCRECYTHYLEQKIGVDGESRRIQCMASDCNLTVDEKTIDLLVKPEMSEKYKVLLNRTYVDDSPSLRWCPGPDCQYAIECHIPKKSLDTVVPGVQCKCGHRFCFGCGLEDHQPCCCPLVKKWLKKCADDSETANWISANTKECPKCQATIEKNGGCNHMTCKKCKDEFCWVCMGNWTEHGTAWYQCNRYEEKADTGKDAQSKSRASLERYLFYHNRYANHEQSAKLEGELYKRIEKKMDEMQTVSSSLSWIEVQFLRKAVEILSECRMTLRWSYAHAYYLLKNNEQDIFETNQADLERAVEDLSGLLERPLEPETIPELRQQVTDKSAYVASRHETLRADAARGSAEGRWTYNITF